MTPGFKFLGSVVIAVLLFVVIVTTARAEEVMEPEVNMTCVTALAPDVVNITAMHAKGTDYWMVRHLILTDPSNRDEARWALMLVTDWMYAGRLPPELAVSFLWDLCSLPPEKVGGLPAKDQEWLKPLQHGGMFDRPLLPEHKDI